MMFFFFRFPAILSLQNDINLGAISFNNSTNFGIYHIIQDNRPSVGSACFTVALLNEFMGVQVIIYILTRILINI